MASEFAYLDPSAEPEAPAKSGGRSRFLIWLVVMSLGFLFLPLFLVSTTAQEQNAAFATELATIQETLSSTPEPDPEEQALNDRLLQIRGQVIVLEALAADLAETHLDWPGTMEILSNYDQGRMSFTGIAQTENRITLTGEAVDEATVMSYTQRLRESPYFERVVVQSMSLRALPTAVPTPRQAMNTPASTGASPSPQPQGSLVEFTILIELRANAS